jgi:hypothetical protein
MLRGTAVGISGYRDGAGGVAAADGLRILDAASPGSID